MYMYILHLSSTVYTYIYIPQKFLSVLLGVASEGGDESPDRVEESVRSDHRPLSRPHHTHQAVHYLGQAAINTYIYMYIHVYTCTCHFILCTTLDKLQSIIHVYTCTCTTIHISLCLFILYLIDCRLQCTHYLGQADTCTCIYMSRVVTSGRMVLHYSIF